MSSSILQVEGLTKHYGDYLAVDHISFDIKEGEVMGLLGPNGAGKSTTIQMLLGLTESDAGQISYFGKDFSQHREYCLDRMNFASAYSELQGRMTVSQNLRVHADLYGLKQPSKRITELLQVFEIEEHKDTLFWHLSSGQKTRVILAKAFLNRPKMLLMDEPTASLDPDIIQKMIQLIKQLQKDEQITILYTSHNMEEVSRLCDRIAFLAKGKIVEIDTPLELTKRIDQTRLILTFEGDHKAIEQYIAQHHYNAQPVAKNIIEVRLPEPKVVQALYNLKDSGIVITNISTQQPSLEDVFLHIAKAGTL